MQLVSKARFRRSVNAFPFTYSHTQKALSGIASTLEWLDW